MLTRIHGLLFGSLLTCAAALASPDSQAADVYDTAVQHAGRGANDLLRRPDDERTLVSYIPPGLGKTDRFVLVFRKKAR
jgi:hypothetical protein